MNGREKYIASKAYRRPVGQFTQQDNVRDFARSGPGQNYFAMQDLQRQAPSFQKGDPRIDELKQRRRLWNRAQKYPAGEILGRTPQDQMEQYRGLSRDLRETAPGAFGQMYPLTSAYHKYTDVGGLTGLALKSGANILKGVGDTAASVYDSFKDATGIGAGLGTTEEELKNYYDLTYPQDVHPGIQDASEFTAPIEDVTESDINEIIVGNLGVEPRPDPNYGDPEYLTWDYKYGDKFNLDGTPKDSGFERIPVPGEFSVPGPGEEQYKDYIDRGLEEMQEPLPFDDSGREVGIVSLYGQGPQWGETNRRYEDEYRDYAEQLGNMPGGPMAYEEFARAYERIHQGKPHAGLR